MLSLILRGKISSLRTLRCVDQTQLAKELIDVSYHKDNKQKAKELLSHQLILKMALEEQMLNEVEAALDEEQQHSDPVVTESNTDLNDDIKNA